MKKLASISIWLLVAACGGSGDMNTAKAIKDKMCSCTDQKCFDEAEQQLKDFDSKMRDKYKSKEDAPKDLVEVAGQIKKCRRELRDKLESGAGKADPGSAAAPATPPAGTPPSGSAAAPSGSATP
jgi:hypothetical protein